ncbi:HNH endonuclease [Schleiferilactobacillus harbinensis]|uniref:HNH endonuclease n=1 Tax=Schleiferilactobacillus harbinensis TaxID=304207 RepID=UPI0039E95925
MISRRRRKQAKQYHECGEPLCHKIIPISQRYCPFHQQQHDDAWQRKRDNYRRSKLGQAIKQQRTREYDNTQRDQSAVKFYHSPQWEAIRDAVYARDGAQCQVCGNVINNRKIVDHIIPRRLCTSSQVFDSSNLWTLCSKCHYRKTKLEQIISAQQNGDNKLRHLNRQWWTKILREKKERK